MYERRLLHQLREQLRVRVRHELLGRVLPNGRQRLLHVPVLRPVAEPLPTRVLPRHPPRRRAGDRVGVPRQRLDETKWTKLYVDGQSFIYIHSFCRLLCFWLRHYVFGQLL